MFNLLTVDRSLPDVTKRDSRLCLFGEIKERYRRAGPQFHHSHGLRLVSVSVWHEMSPRTSMARTTTRRPAPSRLRRLVEVVTHTPRQWWMASARQPRESALLPALTVDSARPRSVGGSRRGNAGAMPQKEPGKCTGKHSSPCVPPRRKTRGETAVCTNKGRGESEIDLGRLPAKQQAKCTGEIKALVSH